jgi:hypothetical protein
VLNEAAKNPDDYVQIAWTTDASDGRLLTVMHIHWKLILKDFIALSGAAYASS